MKEVDMKHPPSRGRKRPLRKFGRSRKSEEESVTSLGFHKDLFKVSMFVGLFLGLLLNPLLFLGGSVSEWTRFFFRWSLMLAVAVLLFSSIRTSLLCDKGKSAKELACAKIRDMMLGFLGSMLLVSALFYITKHIGILLLRAVVG